MTPHAGLRIMSVALVAGVALLPVAAGLAGLAAVEPAAFGHVVTAPGVVAALARSLTTGVAATLVAVVLAHVLLAAAGTAGWLGRLRAASLPLLAVPHLALGIGLVLWLAPSGLALRLLSPWATGFDRPPDWATVQDPYGVALVLGLVIKETAFLLLALAAALAQVPAAPLLRTGRTLGYGRWSAWFAAVAPLLARQTRLAVAAVAVFGVANVELALPLGPRTPPTFAVLVWQWFTSGDLADRELALAGSLLLLLVTGLLLALGAAASAVLARAFRTWVGAGRRHSLAACALLVPVATTLGVLGLAAALALPFRAVTGPVAFPALLPTGPLRAAAVSGLGPVLGDTLVLAVLVAVLAVLLVMPAAEALAARPVARARLATLLFVPLLLPQLAFLFGLQVLLVRLGIDGTLAAVVWSQLLFALPYVWGVLAPGRAALDPRLPLAARTLGAGPWRAWRTVTLPLLARTAFVALALGVAVSAAVYLPTLFAGAGRVTTLATEAAATLTAGNLREATAYGAWQAVVPLGAFALAFLAGAWLHRARRGVPA